MAGKIENFREHTLRINSKPDRKEALRLVRSEQALLIKRHNDFISGMHDEVDLTRFDLRPQVGFVSNGPLQVILQGNDRVGVDYEEIYSRFLKSISVLGRFSKDVLSESTGMLRSDPEPKTKRLKDFILKNPFSRIECMYRAYTLEPDKIGLRYLIIKRYFEDKDEKNQLINPIAEIWTETRL